MAVLATLWAAFAAATVWMGPADHQTRHVALTAVVTITPVLQLVLMGAGALRERSSPGSASFFYIGAVLLLVPQLVIALV